MTTEESIKQLQANIQASEFRQLVSDITENCYPICIRKPGSSLGSSDQKCIADCMDRYVDSYDQVSKLFMSRLTYMSTPQ